MSQVGREREREINRQIESYGRELIGAEEWVRDNGAHKRQRTKTHSLTFTESGSISFIDWSLWWLLLLFLVLMLCHLK